MTCVDRCANPDHYAGCPDLRAAVDVRIQRSLMLTTTEAAKALGLKPSTLRHQIKNGKLAAQKIGPRDWFIHEAEVDRYRRENRARAEGEDVA